MPGTTFKRCGCKDPVTGRPLDTSCPRLRTSGHGSWYFYLEIPGLPGTDRRRLRRGGFRTERAAQQALAVELARAAATHAPREDTTVGQWLEHWLNEKSKRGAASAAGKKIRSATTRAYRSHLDLYLLPHLGQIPLTELAEPHISAMFDTILAGNADRRRRVGPTAMRRIFATLRAALNEAVRRHKIDTNPCLGVELAAAPRPKAVVWTDERVAAWRAGAPRPKVAVWTPAQTGAFLDSAADDRLYAIYHLIAFRGLRRGESVALRWADVDLRGQMMTISQQVIQLGWRTEEDTPKSDAGARVVALDTGTIDVLRRHRELQDQERQTAGSAWVDSGRVFTTADGNDLHPAFVTEHFAELIAAADLPPIRLHDLRHGAATLALAGGADLKVVQHMLGHSSITITADTYTSVLPALAAQAAEAAARMVPRATHGEQHVNVGQDAVDGELGD